MAEPELKEKDFIRETKDPSPMWFWLFIIAVLVLLFSSMYSWFNTQIESYKSGSPFFDVTNRQFSIFLWQNPRYMRVNVSSKHAYLPGFQYLNNVTPDPAMADQPVQAPPDVLFQYHTWKRLISDEFSSRKIPTKEFLQFLDYDREWQTCCWKDAPKDYINLLKDLDPNKAEFIQDEPYTVLPLEVRQAFIGWKNFMFEGDAINAYEPTFAEVQAFLKESPMYARNFWRNIVTNTPKYLMSLASGNFKPEDKVPKDEIDPFLRVALYNFHQAKAGN